MSPSRGVSAGHGAKDRAGCHALRVGADWVQVGKVVTASEVLIGVGRRGVVTCDDVTERVGVTSQRTPKWSGFVAARVVGAGDQSAVG